MFHRYRYSYRYQKKISVSGIGIGMNSDIGIGLIFRYRYRYWYRYGSSAGYQYQYRYWYQGIGGTLAATTHHTFITLYNVWNFDILSLIFSGEFLAPLVLKVIFILVVVLGLDTSSTWFSQSCLLSYSLGSSFVSKLSSFLTI